MATVIGVGMQMTANAAGMTKGLSEADRALQLLQRIVDQNQEAMKRFSGESEKTAQSLGKLTSGVRTLSAIEVGRVLVDGFQAIGGAFVNAAQNVLTLAGNVANSLDPLNDLSARTGIGVEALQGYSLAAKLAGVDTQGFAVAVQRLAVNIGRAAPGDALDKSLRSINLSVNELRSLAPEQQFSAIGDAISRLPTAADRAGAAVEIFGKQGAALAPLFREGAASIDELRDRADRLGIIVSETQINNIADMNDGFDLVRSTIEGIVGQVVGNLAPAVTAVTEEFLRFVEEWSGAQGQGGTGIANAITDVLLRGAEFFAGIFDSFVDNFEGISATLADVGEVFRIGGQLLLTGIEGFRTIFNAIQLGIDALLIGLGRVLEGIGSWVSEDLEQFGAGLAAASEESARKNSAEMEAAAANAANAFAGIFNDVAGDAQAGGEGAAVQFVRGISDRIQQERSPQFKVETNLDETQERLAQFLASATDGGSEFLQQSTETLETFQRMAGEGELTAAQIQVMTGFMQRLNGELDLELQKRAEATELAQQQAAADSKRVDALLATGDAASKLEEDLAAVERERQRIAEAGAEDAQDRLAQLDTLRANLEEQQQALDQGFGKGFADAFREADSVINAAIEKSAEFGQAGFDAAQKLSAGIAEAQRKAQAGIFTAPAYEQEVARQRALFDQRIELEKVALAERKKADEEATRVRLQQEQLVNDLIKQQQFGGDGERIKAAENLLAIEAEIARAKEAQAKARAEDDKEAVAAATRRLAQLDQVQAKELDIVSGAAAQREASAAAEQELLKSQESQRQAIFQQQQKFAEEQAKAQQAEFERQAKRIGELNTLGPTSVQTADIRTQQGQDIVFDLFNQQQDPQLIQLRQTNKVLTTIATRLAANLERIGQAAAIF